MTANPAGPVPPQHTDTRAVSQFVRGVLAAEPCHYDIGSAIKLLSTLPCQMHIKSPYSSCALACCMLTHYQPIVAVDQSKEGSTTSQPNQLDAPLAAFSSGKTGVQVQVRLHPVCLAYADALSRAML